MAAAAADERVEKYRKALVLLGKFLSDEIDLSGYPPEQLAELHRILQDVRRKLPGILERLPPAQRDQAMWLLDRQQPRFDAMLVRVRDEWHSARPPVRPVMRWRPGRVCARPRARRGRSACGSRSPPDRPDDPDLDPPAGAAA